MAKLRGLRIELDEIAHAILAASHGTLTDAAVTVRGDPEFLYYGLMAKSLGRMRLVSH
jgi:aspyridone synthetase (hybrid polyketide synthase/nonribosomal peptide synthetase)